MDLVLLDHFDSYGLKRTKSDVQRDFGSFDATGADAVEHFGREVQSGSRSRDRAQRLGINRLALLAIERRVGTVDVRRQRDVSDALDHREEVGDGIKAQVALAEFATRDDLGRQ